MTDKMEARRKKWRALEKLPFTAEEKKRWAEMLHRTWQAIGHDAEVACRQSRVRLTKGILVDYVCDHIDTYGGITPDEREFFSVCYQRPSFQKWMRKELNYV